MKYLGLILVLALVAGQVLAFGINENDSQLQHVRHKRSLNDNFYNFLQNFKTVLREGNETLGLPPMDPYVNKELNLVINETMALGTAQFRNVNAVGLAGYDIHIAEVSMFPPTVTVGLSWSQFFADSAYIFKVLIADKYNAFGDGHFVCTATDVIFETTIKFSILNHLKVTSMQTKIALGDLKLQLTGLFDDEQISEMVSVVFSDIAPEIVETYQDEITTIVNKKAEALINSELEGKSFQDIIDILG